MAYLLCHAVAVKLRHHDVYEYSAKLMRIRCHEHLQRLYAIFRYDDVQPTCAEHPFDNHAVDVIIIRHEHFAGQHDFAIITLVLFLHLFSDGKPPAWYLHRELRSLADGALHIYLCAHDIYQPADDGESQSRARHVLRAKRIIHLLGK